MATTDMVARPAPEIESDEAQQEAMHSRLRAHRRPRGDGGVTGTGKTGGAVIERWAAVRVAGRIRHVGRLVGGHTRLEAGRWVVTSAVIAYDPKTMTAVTGSSGRTYHLFDRLAMPFPAELPELLFNAFRVWRLPATPIEFVAL